MFHGPTLNRFRNGDRVVVRMSGEFDLAWRDILRDELDEAISAAPPPPRLLVGLADVTFMDSTVIGVLIAVHKDVAALNGSVALVEPRAPIRRLLAITHVDQVLAVFDSEPDALADPALADLALADPALADPALADPALADPALSASAVEGAR